VNRGENDHIPAQRGCDVDAAAGAESPPDPPRAVDSARRSVVGDADVQIAGPQRLRHAGTRVRAANRRGRGDAVPIDGSGVVAGDDEIAIRRRAHGRIRLGRERGDPPHDRNAAVAWQADAEAELRRREKGPDRDGVRGRDRARARRLEIDNGRDAHDRGLKLGKSARGYVNGRARIDDIVDDHRARPGRERWPLDAAGAAVRLPFLTHHHAVQVRAARSGGEDKRGDKGRSGDSDSCANVGV
jgi:hypothetical protein